MAVVCCRVSPLVLPEAPKRTEESPKESVSRSTRKNEPWLKVIRKLYKNRKARPELSESSVEAIFAVSKARMMALTRSSNPDLVARFQESFTTFCEDCHALTLILDSSKFAKTSETKEHLDFFACAIEHLHDLLDMFEKLSDEVQEWLNSSHIHPTIAIDRFAGLFPSSSRLRDVWKALPSSQRGIGLIARVWSLYRLLHSNPCFCNKTVISLYLLELCTVFQEAKEFPPAILDYFEDQKAFGASLADSLVQSISMIESHFWEPGIVHHLCESLACTLHIIDEFLDRNREKFPEVREGILAGGMLEATTTMFDHLVRNADLRDLREPEEDLSGPEQAQRDLIMESYEILTKFICFDDASRWVDRIIRKGFLSAMYVLSQDQQISKRSTFPFVTGSDMHLQILITFAYQPKVLISLSTAVRKAYQHGGSTESGNEWKLFERQFFRSLVLRTVRESQVDHVRLCCNNPTCDNDGLRSRLKRCSKCLGVYYCSQECQHDDWRLHSKYCYEIAKDEAPRLSHSEKVSLLNSALLQIEEGRDRIIDYVDIDKGSSLPKYCLKLSANMPSRHLDSSGNNPSLCCAPFGGCTLEELLNDPPNISRYPALARQLAECALKRVKNGLEDHLLLECLIPGTKHVCASESTTRDPFDSDVMFSALVRVNWSSLKSNKRVFCVDTTALAIRDRCRWLARNPSALSSYWTSGAMTKDIERTYAQAMAASDLFNTNDRGWHSMLSKLTEAL